jgi:hypothetical protein
MLTEKQLQALVGCGEKEDCTGETCPMFETCDNDYTNKVAAEAAKTALAYREMLERLEFAGKSDMGGWKCCPICGVGIDDRNHASDCALAKLLKEGSK